MDNFDIKAGIRRTLAGKAFTRELEDSFRAHHRRRFRYPRAGLLLILALVFSGSQWNSGVLFGADWVAYPLLHVLSVHVAAPANLLAFLAVLFGWPREVGGATQVAAAIASVGCTVCLREVALNGHLTYPSHLTGLLLISGAVLGGYSWKRVLVGTLLFAGGSMWSELQIHARPASILNVYSLAIMAAIAIVGAFTHELLARLAWLYNRYAAHLARTDALTGLANRLEFNRTFPRILAQAQRDRRMIAVMLLDLDHFKKINDDHGHLTGDEVLRRIGEVLRKVARRPLDMRVRYGGEEVLVVWYDVCEKSARQLAESTLENIRRMRVQLPGRAESVCVTASAGMIWLVPSASTTMAEILNKSDKLLYAAKAAGRNCVMTEPLRHAAA